MTAPRVPAARRRWEPGELEAVVENARELAFVGHETMEAALPRLGYGLTVSQLEKILRDARALDVLRQFTANGPLRGVR